MHDPRDERKRAIAAALISDLADGVLLWQVACEYVSVARKLEAYGFNLEAAVRHITILSGVWPVVFPSWTTFQKAAELMASRRLSWWDSLLLAVPRSPRRDAFFGRSVGWRANRNGADR